MVLKETQHDLYSIGHEFEFWISAFSTLFVYEHFSFIQKAD